MTTTATIPVADGRETAAGPYGVRVGDRVFYWRDGAPPLSSKYEKPDCLPALVLAFRSAPASWAPQFQVWHADLAYVDAEGSLRVVTNIPQVESSATASGSERHYGTPASWHRDIIHQHEETR